MAPNPYLYSLQFPRLRGNGATLNDAGNGIGGNTGGGSQFPGLGPGPGVAPADTGVGPTKANGPGQYTPAAPAPAPNLGVDGSQGDIQNHPLSALTIDESAMPSGAAGFEQLRLDSPYYAHPYAQAAAHAAVGYGGAPPQTGGLGQMTAPAAGATAPTTNTAALSPLRSLMMGAIGNPGLQT